MRRKIIFMTMVLSAVALVCCEQYDDSEIKEAIEDLEDRVSALEALDGEVASLKAMVEGQVSVVSHSSENGVHTIILSNGETIVIDASKEESASPLDAIPVVTILEEGGKIYWAYHKDGSTEYLLSAGEKVEVAAAVPEIRVDEYNTLEVSVDGGKTWVSTGATISGSLFSKVEEDGDALVFTLSDGSAQFVVPLLDEGQMQFAVLCGKQYFDVGETKTLEMGMVGIDNFTVTEKPEGWKVRLEEGLLTVKAPEQDAMQSSLAEKGGTIKMLAVGKSFMIAELKVELGKAAISISVGDDMLLNVSSLSGGEYFYGASSMEDFDPEAIASRLNDVTNISLSREQHTKEPIIGMPLSDLLNGAEVEAGETYVAWAVLYSSGGYHADDVYFDAVTSIGVNYEIGDLSFDDAAFKVAAKGTDTFYLIRMDEDLTVDNYIEDISGSWGYMYDENMHSSTFRGRVSDFVDYPVSGQTYSFLVVPVYRGALCSKELAVTFDITLTDIEYTGGASSVILENAVADLRTLSVDVIPDSRAYRVYADIIPAAEYDEAGYADAAILLNHLKTVVPMSGAGIMTYSENGLEPDTEYYAVAAALDRSGAFGFPTVFKTATKAVVRSSASVVLGEAVLAPTEVVVPVSSQGGEIERYRYFLLSDSGSDSYFYHTYINDDTAAYESIIYQTVATTEVVASQVSEGIVLSGLETGVPYLFCIVGYDAEGGVTQMQKCTFTPTLGNVIKKTNALWTECCPSVTSAYSGANALKISVEFPEGYECEEFVFTKVSSEEFRGNVSTVARLRTDYVMNHYYAVRFAPELGNFDLPLKDYVPDWYVTAGDPPYILLTWKDAVNGWFEPVVFDSRNGNLING